MPTSNDQPVLTDEMMQALRRSGYLMESRINRVLRDSGWFVDANNFIPDPQTGTPRESDLVANRAHQFGKGERHQFANVIAIECINNDQPVVFLSRVPSSPAEMAQYYRIGGWPRSIDVAQDPTTGRKSAVDLPIVLGLEKSHRFVRLPAYDMYCTFVPRKSGQPREKGELRAEHPNDWHGTFQKVIHTAEYFRELHDRMLIQGVMSSLDDPTMWITHYHHAVVFKGPLIAVNQPDAVIEGGDLSGAVERCPHLLYRRTVGKGTSIVSTLVDIVVEDHLPEYLKLLETEAEHFCTVLAGNVDNLLSRVKPDVTQEFQQLIAKDPNFG